MKDSYSRLDYRRMIAWPRRIQREEPLLCRALGPPAGRRVLDLGCGTGEHARFLAERGYEVVGVDRSPSMLERATEEPPPKNLRFVESDLENLEDAVDGTFDGAICLGNTLPHLRSHEGLARFLLAVRRRLRPGAALLIQLLNYERIFAREIRHLPLNFRPHGEEDAEIVFLRLMRPGKDGAVSFFPTSLKLTPGQDPPVQITSSKQVELMGWRRSELQAALGEAGFVKIESLGSFEEEAFQEEESPDLIVVAQ